MGFTVGAFFTGQMSEIAFATRDRTWCEMLMDTHIHTFTNTLAKVATTVRVHDACQL